MLHHFGANARVRVGSESGHSLQVRPRPLVHKCPLCINTDRKFWALGFVAMCQLRTSAALHSIISSAMLSSLSGTVRPSILAVEELMTNSNLLDCTTGRSAGFAPLRMRPA